MARKKEDTADNNDDSRKYQKEQKSSNSRPSTPRDKQNKCLSLRSQLAMLGLSLREIPGDGNCLFRALGDQLEGHTRKHLKHREDVAEFMRNHRKDFEPFVEDDVPFDRHLVNLSEEGTFAGNDAIVAFARLHQVIVVIHQLNYPMWQVSGLSNSYANGRQFHIAYHNGDHYSSVRRVGDKSDLPPNIHVSLGQPSSEGEIANPICKSSSTLLPSPSLVNYSDEEEETEVDSGNLDLDMIIERIAVKTGCDNYTFISEALENNKYVFEEAVREVVAFVGMSRSLEAQSPTWSPSGTGYRIFGDLDGAEGGAKPKLGTQEKLAAKLALSKKLSNRQRQELKKQERKRENLERKKKSGGNGTEIYYSPPRSESGSSSALVPEMECLSI